jgi:hypothetical protein
VTIFQERVHLFDVGLNQTAGDVTAATNALSHLSIVIIAFNVLTGLMLGEIMNLKWANCDESKKEITVQSKSECRVKGGKMKVIPAG